MPTGTRPRRSGSAKVVRPSPPYIVPRREKRAGFWLIGKRLPSQIAQPRGAKLKPKTQSCPINGSIVLSCNFLGFGCFEIASIDSLFGIYIKARIPRTLIHNQRTLCLYQLSTRAQRISQKISAAGERLFNARYARRQRLHYLSILKLDDSFEAPRPFSGHEAHIPESESWEKGRESRPATRHWNVELRLCARFVKHLVNCIKPTSSLTE